MSVDGIEEIEKYNTDTKTGDESEEMNLLNIKTKSEVLMLLEALGIRYVIHMPESQGTARISR